MPISLPGLSNLDNAFLSRVKALDESCAPGDQLAGKVIALTGASGLLGQALCALLESLGCKLVILKHGVDWNAAEPLPAGKLLGVDVMVHLAGEPLLAKGLNLRWSAKKKRAIADSRIEGTKVIAEACVHDHVPVLLSGSAVGFYGDRDQQVLDEQSDVGTGYLARTCQAWEQSAIEHYQLAADVSSRLVLLRTGVVLTPQGGALEKMLRPFRLGLGGRLGDGKMGVPWIGLEDWLLGVLFCMQDKRVLGPVNLSSPSLTDNAELTQRLARAINRPALFPVPLPALRMLAGKELVDELLAASCFAQPKRLTDLGYEFIRPNLDSLFKSMFN